jgi:hypothetical protein
MNFAIGIVLGGFFVVCLVGIAVAATYIGDRYGTDLALLVIPALAGFCGPAFDAILSMVTK